MDVLDLLARDGLIARSDVDLLRDLLRERGGLPVAAVADEGLVADETIADAVAREVGSVVIDLDRGTLERDAVQLLPESVARRLLALVVAVEPGGRSVRAAFADPLDDGAINEVAAVTGRSVRVLVATVSAIRRAIGREYPETTRVVAAGNTPHDEDLAPESTRRVATARGRNGESVADEIPRTLPVHRLEQEATIEQRHEALLLALIEKGVITRAEYADALKRLLGRR